MGPSEDIKSASRLTGPRKQGHSLLGLGWKVAVGPDELPQAPLCGQDSPPTRWCLQASFAGTAAWALERGGAGVVYTLLSLACSPLFLHSGQPLQCAAQGQAEGRAGWREWAVGPTGPCH